MDNCCIINELYRCWSQRLHVHQCMPPLKPPRSMQTICIFFDGGTSVKRIGQRKQIVSCWAVGCRKMGRKSTVCLQWRKMLWFCCLFTIGSVIIYSTLSKSNLALIYSTSSIFNVESSGARQMTKINKHNKAEYYNWPEENWPSSWTRDYQETSPLMACKVEGGEDTRKQKRWQWQAIYVKCEVWAWYSEKHKRHWTYARIT